MSESESASMSESGSEYDSNEEENVEEDEINVTSIDSQPLKRARKYYDLPTKEEQMYLRETDSLMQSNLLNMQVGEMLDEVLVDRFKENRKSINKWLESFTEVLNACKIKKSNLPITSSFISVNSLSGVQLENPDVTLDYKQPSSVDVIGSFSTGTATKPYLNIDILVTMNSDSFTQK